MQLIAFIWKHVLCNPPAVLLIVGTFVAAIAAYFKERDSSSRRISVAIFAGGIIVLISVVLSGVQQSRQDEDLLTLTKTNAVLNAKIAELNEHIAQSITGGDSFGYFEFAGTVRKPFIFRHKGKHTLYEAKCRIVNLGDYSKLPSRSPAVGLGILSSTERRINLGTIRKGSWGLQPDYNITTKDIQGYDIFFEARNGRWEQKIRIRRIATGFRCATLVSRRKGETVEILHKHVADGFPLNTNGKVDWYKVN